MAKSKAKAVEEAEEVAEGTEETEGEYRSLYQKYRPHSFEDVLGQDHIVKPLLEMVKANRVPQTHLFTGERGTGKTTTGRILAQALNCEDIGDNGEPCNSCMPCTQIAAGVTGAGIDVLDGASTRGIDDVRQMVLERVGIASTFTRRRVFLIDEVHALTKNAVESLLLTLEQPPAGVFFILCTTEGQAIMPTIRSRSTTWNFRTIKEDILADLVNKIIDGEGREVDDATVAQIVAEGNGSARDTISVLERVLSGGEISSKDWAEEIFDGLLENRLDLVFLSISGAIDEGKMPSEITRSLFTRARNAMLCLHAPDLVNIVATKKDHLVEQAEALKASRLTRLAGDLADAASTFMASGGPDQRFMLETALVKFLEPDQTLDDLDAVLDGMDEIKETLVKLEERVVLGKMGSLDSTERPLADFAGIFRQESVWPGVDDTDDDKDDDGAAESDEEPSERASEPDESVESDKPEKKKSKKASSKKKEEADEDRSEKAWDAIADAFADHIHVEVSKSLARLVKNADVVYEECRPNEIALEFEKALSDRNYDLLNENVSPALKKEFGITKVYVIEPEDD